MSGGYAKLDQMDEHHWLKHRVDTELRDPERFIHRPINIQLGNDLKKDAKEARQSFIKLFGERL